MPVPRPPSRLAAAAAAIALAAAAPGCGGGEDEPAPEPPAQTAAAPENEAAPEASPATGAEAGEAPLAVDDEVAVRAAVEAYVTALNRRDGAAVCALMAPGALPESELPRRLGSCAASLGASLGARPRDGGPAWRRTRIAEARAVSVGADRARATVTVTHRFSDRAYTSIEEDVVYLGRAGDRWLLAKPSGTLYRAVGYPEPPLRALAPPG